MPSPPLNEPLSPLSQVADRCGDSEPPEDLLASISDPNEIERLVVEGPSLRLRQLAAQRVEGRDELNRLLKRLQGKDKSVYRILKDKRDALREEAHQASQADQDIRTIYSSLEALLRVLRCPVCAALEHFEARWRIIEGQGAWAPERVGASHHTAIRRSRAPAGDRTAHGAARQSTPAHERAPEALAQAALV